MAVLNPNIVLAGRQPDVVNALAGGARAASLVNDVRQQNALTALYQEQGPGIVAGEQDAMNALARFSPQEALGIENTRQTMDVRDQENARADERLRLARAEARRQAETHLADMNAAEAASRLSRLDRALAMAAQAQNPEEFARVMQEAGMPDYADRWEDREMLIAGALGLKDVLEMRAGPKPQSPEGKLQADINAGLVDPGALAGDPSAAEAEIARIMELPDPTRQGQTIDRPTAIMIRDGVVRVDTDPVTRETRLIDLRTGRPYERGSPGASSGITPAGGVSESALRGIPGEAQPSLSYGDQFSASDDAFGAEGFFRRGVNTAAGIVGADPVYDDVEETQADFGVLREDLLRNIAGAYGGRPPVYLLENIQRLIPEAGRITQGSGRAQSQLRALGRSFETEAGSLRRQLDGRRLDPNDRAALESQLTAVETAKSRVDAALRSFGATGEAEQDDDALINKYLQGEGR